MIISPVIISGIFEEHSRGRLGLDSATEDAGKSLIQFTTILASVIAL